MDKEFSARLMQSADKDEYFNMSRDFYASGVTNSVIDDNGREKFWKEILSKEIVRGYFILCDGKTAGYAVCCLYKSLGYADANYLSLYKKTAKEN